MRLLAVLLLTCALAGCAGGPKRAVTPTPTPTATVGIAGVQVFPGLSHQHLGKGQYPQSYPQSPPVGGPHSPVWLACGVYEVPLPKENAVHSMEHGGIWITYSTELPASAVADLAQLAKLSPEYVMVSPYSGQDHPVIASTWGLQLRVDSAADPRLVAFVKAYAGGNQGGEKGVGCRTGGVTPAQAEQFDAGQR